MKRKVEMWRDIKFLHIRRFAETYVVNISFGDWVHFWAPIRFQQSFNLMAARPLPFKFD